VNGPASVVVSGVEAGVEQVVAGLAGDGVRVRRLRVSHAFHSPLMDPMLAEFRAVAAGLSYQPPRIPMVSTVTGEAGDAEQWCDPEYWVRQVRQPVRFADAIASVHHIGITAYLEAGPDAVLSTMVSETLSTETVTVTALRDDRPEQSAIVAALAHLHTHGVDIDWTAHFTDTGARHTDLPTYAFQHERFWPEVSGWGGAQTPTDAVDAEFWAAVEGGDVRSLAARMDVEREALDAVLPALSSWRRDRRERSVADSWRYGVTWKPTTVGTTDVLSGTWLVVTPAELATDGWVDDVIDALATTAIRLPLPDADRASWAALVAESVPDATQLAGVVSLLALRPGLAGGLLSTMVLAQALGDAGVLAPLWCLTRGAVAATRSDVLRDVPQAGVWGWGRVAALEYPLRWGGLVDLPERIGARVGARLNGVLARPDGEDQVAIRASGVFVRRLARVTCGAADGVWRPHGTVLITGGTGALGAHTARWLAGHGVEHLLLTSRRGLRAPGAVELRDELIALGARVTVVACDVADRDALAAVLADVPAEYPLTGVVHTAGVSVVKFLDETTADDLAEVTSAKVAGAVNLDALLADRELDFFVLFSSIAATWGSGGQAGYGAANAYLDALAEQRRGRGLAATSVAWGAWAESGMGAAEGAQDYLSRRGVRSMPPAPAITALWRAVANLDVTVTVADIAWEQFVPTFTSVRPSALLSDLPEARSLIEAARASQRDAATATTALQHRLSGLNREQQDDLLLDIVRQQVATVLRHQNAEAIEPGRAFGDLGFDSVTAVELRNALRAATGLELPATLVFDYPTPAVLADYLAAEIVPVGTTASQPSLLAELDRFEAILADSAVDDVTRGGVTIRLQELLSKVSETTADNGGIAASELLESASTDEIFDFINNELGLRQEQ
jgi:acyl transferase domain-containing protein/acyl carrier protein